MRVILTNCTLNQNSTPDPATKSSGLHCTGGATAIVTQCIFWDNDGPEIVQSTVPVEVSYSDVEGGWPGTSNINADPLFQSIPSGAFAGSCYLAANSPCIDFGSY